ncbi:uncharacterized protein J7T54_002967 [Emericellopsis cladophorae]|uniref:Uncharacterized protein n=1 Tax=Emericellopsis cladophorae TaxID=2686198 RepID=A0A9P9XTJ6_9HYPO|nr:uncharacterized protein J7T54_002967 [Emericellopsis cladophorae]KAI6777565.1 hypothetical protein J7T54_002967 [Emericellopsis cladophorae]
MAFFGSTQLGYGIAMYLKKIIVSSVSNLDGKVAVEHEPMGSDQNIVLIPIWEKESRWPKEILCDLFHTAQLSVRR